MLAVLAYSSFCASGLAIAIQDLLYRRFAVTLLLVFAISGWWLTNITWSTVAVNLGCCLVLLGAIKGLAKWKAREANSVQRGKLTEVFGEGDVCLLLLGGLCLPTVQLLWVVQLASALGIGWHVWSKLRGSALRDFPFATLLLLSLAITLVVDYAS